MGLAMSVVILPSAALSISFGREYCVRPIRQFAVPFKDVVENQCRQDSFNGEGRNVDLR